MSPSATKVALGRQTSCLRVSRGGEVAVGTDIEGTVFMIVACIRAPKAFSEGRSRAMSNRDIEEASGSRDDWTIVTNSYDKRLIVSYCIFVQAVFRVDGSERGRGVGQGRGEFGAGTGSGDGEQCGGSSDWEI